MASAAVKSVERKGRLEEIKKECIRSILHLFMRDLTEPYLDADQKESLTVAKQCLEACYEIDESKAEGAADLVEIFEAMNIPPTRQELDVCEAEAEQYKIRGNDCMKDGEYSRAVEQYTMAIGIHNTKAIYFCNRAAAYSRLELHREAIADCKEAIKLDPTYGKAYGRLGIAYSNLSLYKEAAEAYKKALELDPTNASYEANLKLAEEKITPGAGSANAPNLPGLNFDFGGFMNNPALLNMASQMLNDPSFRNMVSGIMTSGPGGDPNLDSFVEVGQQLAEHMQANNPNVLENLRQTFSVRGQDQPPEDNPDEDEHKND